MPHISEFEILPYDVLTPQEQVAQMGLIVLSSDLTIEDEFRYFFSGISHQDLSLWHNRIPMDDKVSANSLAAMEQHFAQVLKNFPPHHIYDVIGYGCTSAALILGDDKIRDIVISHSQAKHVTTPMAAAKNALAHLKAKKLIYLAPYISDISHRMCETLDAAGHHVIKRATYAEERDSVVGMITPASIASSLEKLLQEADDADAVFVSCTSLKCASIIPTLEQAYKLPILSSNAVLAWDMANLAQHPIKDPSKGILFS